MDTVAIVVADASGTIRQWSPGASRLFGHLPEDVLGCSLDVIVPERYRQAHWGAFAAVMAGYPGKLDGACANIPVRCHGEQVRTFPGRFSFVRDPYGRVIAAIFGLVTSPAAPELNSAARDRSTRRGLP